MLTKLDYLREWWWYHIPFALGTEHRHLLKKELKGSQTVLDICCGLGSNEIFGKYDTTGIDIFDVSLDVAKGTGYYTNIIKMDMRNLTFTDKSFDTVVCMEGIEHIKKEDGYKLLTEMERIAKKKVILTTPWGNDLKPREKFNPYQTHACGWFPEELKTKGYKIIPIVSIDLRKGTRLYHSAINLVVLWAALPLIYVFHKPFCANFAAIKELK